MKKKILSLTAVVLAMAMTSTSVFAAVGDGSAVGNLDKATTNDVVKINPDLDPAAGDYTGDGIVNDADKAIVMQYLLRPKYVKESYKMTIATSSIFENGISLFDAGKFAEATTDARGVQSVKPDPTIEDVMVEVKDALKADSSKLNTSLNNIWFNSAIGKVELKNETGWAMFCWAVQDIVPVTADTEKVLADAKATKYTVDAANKYDAASAEEKGRADALKRVHDAIGVDAAGTGIDVKAADLDTILTDLETAFPNTLTNDEIKAAAERVLSIVNSRFDLTITSEKVTGNVSADNEALMNAVYALKDYKAAKLSDVSAQFGENIRVENKEKNSGNVTFAEYTLKLVAENTEM